MLIDWMRPDLVYCPHPYNGLAPGFPSYTGLTDAIEYWLVINLLSNL